MFPVRILEPGDLHAAAGVDVGAPVSIFDIC
jgi:hypothetical protein